MANILFSALDILTRPQANPAAVTAYLVVEVQVLIVDAVIFERVACTAMFPLPNIDVLLIVFNVTGQLVQFIDSTYSLVAAESEGCNSRLPHIARNTNWSIQSAVRSVLS